MAQRDNEGILLIESVWDIKDDRYAELLYDTQGTGGYVVSEQYVKSLNAQKQKKLREAVAEELKKKNFPGITDKQKWILKLYLRGQTQDDIADIMGINQSTVCKQLKAAGKSLKKFYEKKKKEN